MNTLNNYIGVTVDQQRALDAAVSSFMTRVYAWMAFALFLTGVTAYWIANSQAALTYITSHSGLFFGLIIAQLLLVMILSAGIQKLSASAATLIFVGYSILTGVTFSFLFLIYTQESLASTFCVTGGTFATMSFYGMVTRRDLSKWGAFLFMALLGLIVGTIVNLFWANSTLYWITTYAGVLIFVGLTAVDTQKLKEMSIQIGEQNPAKWAIFGALTLYLDFINMFLFLLRLFGRRR